MQQKTVRIFVSGELVRAAERKTATKNRAPGRPNQHSTCLILAMIAAKSFFNIGYRETWRVFAERGFTKLPDFRTIHWRASELKQRRIGMDIKVKNSRNEYFILVTSSDNDAFVSKNRVGSKRWQKLMRSLKTDFVELAL